MVKLFFAEGLVMKKLFVAVLFFMMSAGTLFAQRSYFPEYNDLLYLTCEDPIEISEGTYSGYNMSKCFTDVISSSNYRECYSSDSEYVYANKICVYYDDGHATLKVTQNVNGSRVELYKEFYIDNRNCTERKYNSTGAEISYNSGRCNANMQKEEKWTAYGGTETYKDDLLDGPCYYKGYQRWRMVTISGNYAVGVKHGRWETLTVENKRVNWDTHRIEAIKTKLIEIYNMGKLIRSSTTEEMDDGVKFDPNRCIFD